jgi:hypothetical protein
MKIKALLVSFSLVTSLALSTILFSACTPKETNNQTPPKTDTTQQTPPKTDAVTTASIVNNEAAFLKAISKDGTWIIATLKDLSFNENLTLDGQFKNKDVLARKIALYTQDDNKNVTARFTLKAPKLTVKSENARIQSGTFVGDVYVEANGFQLVDAKVDGNIYFSSEDFKASFKKDDKSSVTKNIEVKK